MLSVRPNCEYCDRDLAPGSTEAMICSYECTFCASCAETILHNVCPNCGGGFERRPVRPAKAHRSGTGLTHHPASTERVLLKYDRGSLSAFIDSLSDTRPQER